MKNMYFHVHTYILYCRKQIREKKKDLVAFENMEISGVEFTIEFKLLQ